MVFDVSVLSFGAMTHQAGEVWNTSLKSPGALASLLILVQTSLFLALLPVTKTSLEAK